MLLLYHAHTEPRRANILIRLCHCYFHLEDYESLLKNLENFVIVQQLINQIEHLKTISQQNLSQFRSYLVDYLELWRQILMTDTDKIAALEQGQPFFQKLVQYLVELGAEEEALLVSEIARARAFADLIASQFSSQKIGETFVKTPTISKIKQIAKEQNATIVEYLIIEEISQLYIWIVQSNGDIYFESVNLKFLTEQKTCLSDFIIQFRSSLGFEQLYTDSSNLSEAKSINCWIFGLQQLYQILIEEISHFLPKEHNSCIIFIPQGPLFLVPFPALQYPLTSEFLVKRYRIVK